jgi:hypothetical protein
MRTTGTGGLSFARLLIPRATLRTLFAFTEAMQDCPVAHLTVLCLHGLQSHGDILANAMRRSAAAAASLAAVGGALASCRFEFPLGPVPVARTFTMAGAVVATAVEPAGGSDNFESLQLLGWLPPRCG